MQLSKLESYAVEKINDNNFRVFKIKDLCLVLSIDRTKAYNIIKALKRKNIIRKAGKRFFALKGTDEFIIATAINSPSYISFWSALNYYGFSDQTPRKIFIVATKQAKEIDNIRYITFSKKRFFGYIRIGEIIIADKEKSIIDSLLFPKYSGGIKEIIKCLDKGIKDINMDKLLDYALKIENKLVLRRLGYILDEKFRMNKKLNIIRKKIGKGYELLDPNLMKKNNLNKKWLLDINI